MIAITNTKPVKQWEDISAVLLPDQWRGLWDLHGNGNPANQPFWALRDSVRVAERPAGLPGIEVVARCLPMVDVSGDYYGFLPLDEGQIGLAIGDACGKGMGAAQLMASVYVALHLQARVCSTAGELLNYLNRITCRNTAEDRFVTFIYGIWDVEDHTFTYSRAGHPPVLHYQAATGHVSKLSVGGMVLGVYENVEYPMESVSLGIGDVLVLYTDGITEAVDATDETFGTQRLTQVVAAHGKDSPEALATAILDAASQFAHRGWEDDVTLVIVKRANI